MDARQDVVWRGGERDFGATLEQIQAFQCRIDCDEPPRVFRVVPVSCSRNVSERKSAAFPPSCRLGGRVVMGRQAPLRGDQPRCTGDRRHGRDARVEEPQ